MRRREVALEVHLDHRVPLVLLHVHEHAVAEDPGVVDEDVEAAEALDRRLHHAFGAGEVGDVLAVRDRLAAERLDLADDVVRRPFARALAGERRAEVVDDDLRAGARERERVLAADPAPGAGDDRDLARSRSGIAYVRLPRWISRSRRNRS